MKTCCLLAIFLGFSALGWPQEVKDSFTDTRDGNSYQIIKIGTQVWMRENLAWLPAVGISSVGSDTHKHYYVYGYEGNDLKAARAVPDYKTYGVLYNWPAAKSACPAGWHLPGDDEWKTLEKSLGMSETEVDNSMWRSSGNVGMQMKSDAGWLDRGNGNNFSRFSAIPAGSRYYDGDFGCRGNRALFWTATKSDEANAWGRYLYSDMNAVFRGVYGLSTGFSVRCVKDQ